MLVESKRPSAAGVLIAQYDAVYLAKSMGEQSCYLEERKSGRRAVGNYTQLLPRTVFWKDEESSVQIYEHPHLTRSNASHH